MSYTVGFGGACSYVTSGDAFSVWNTPVSLPEGSVVHSLRIYYYDTSTANSSSWFTIYDSNGSIVQEWSASTTGNSGSGFSDSAVISHTIDYDQYSYLLNWRPNGTGSSLQLCGFRLFYEPPPFGVAFMPLVRK